MVQAYQAYSWFVQEIVDDTVTKLIDGMSKLVKEMQDQSNAHKELDAVSQWLK